jgi:archaemetzincin
MKCSGSVLLLLSILVSGCKEIRSILDNEKQIAIQPLGKVDQSLINSIQSSLESVYNSRVVVLPEKPIYSGAFTHIKTPRYRADSILKFLKRDMPDSIDHILGITMKDISTTKYEIFPLKIKQPVSKYKDWGVFGLGMCPGKSCVVSTFRTRQCSTKRLHQRMQKIAVHEVGHNFGLRHCPNKNCVMTDAVESIRTVDNAPLKLCDNCLSKL